MVGRLLVVAALGVWSTGQPAPAPAAEPNIVLIFTDDAGFADFGFQGSETHRTPHIDSIARAGVRFSQAYVTASVCSPSRAGLLTGRYQQRFGHEYNLPGMDDPAVPSSLRGLPLGEVTIAELLGRAGYVTGLVGKWHLGRHARFHPERRGFDEFFGMIRGGSPYLPGTATAIFDGLQAVDADRLPYLTDAFGDRAADFIERNASHPFFLFLSFNAPHTPLEAPAEALASARSAFDTAERATNATMTASIDANVGKVLDALERHGLRDNTLVIFTNDNGGAMPYNASLNDPLRGTKGTVLEGGNRVPFAMRWPGGLPAGVVYELPISTLDVLPTAIAVASGSLPADREYDGVDLLPYLRGERSTRPHETLYWKLNWGAAVRQGDWKLVRTPADELWLFDLAADPGERNDLAARRPELVVELRALLEAWEATLPAPLWVSESRWRAHSLLRYDQEVVEGYKRR